MHENNTLQVENLNNCNLSIKCYLYTVAQKNKIYHKNTPKLIKTSVKKKEERFRILKIEKC